MSLADLYKGATLTMRVRHQSLCPHCHGSGANSPDDVETCPKCQGRGQVIHTVRSGNIIQQTQMQ